MYCRPGAFTGRLFQRAARAHDAMLRCRITAAFRSQVERRIYAAEGVREEICPAPKGVADGLSVLHSVNVVFLLLFRECFLSLP
jgi:hypothetical protein